MKRIIILTMLCIGFVGFSTKSFAQSTQIDPFAGATHTYGFADIEAKASYEFYVSTSTDHTDATAIITNFGKFVNNDGDEIAATGTIGATAGPASIKIRWDDNAASLNSGNGVYLYLKVTAEGDSCGEPGNYKGVHITPVANTFDIAVTGPTIDPDCFDITGLQPIINKTVPTATNEYVPGETSFTFTITRKTGSNAWSGDYSVSCSEGTVPFTIDATAAAIGDKAGTITGETGDSVTVTVKMVNTPGTKPIFTLTMTSASDDVTGLQDLTLGSETHTFNLMPKIGDFISE